MPPPIIPWEPCNFPEEIQDELYRRKKNRSLRYIENTDLGNWDKYRGPMSPWVRLCSNSKGLQYQQDKDGNIATNEDGSPIPVSSSKRKEGFVLFGGKGFYSNYGFSQDRNNPSIIGYVPSAGISPHIIENDLNRDYPIHVPAPEIERISVSIQKELYRRASVEWVCFSKKQLEYLTPYFLVPGITCIMEWGWNLYNPKSLVDLTDVGELEKLFNNPYPLYTKNILLSKGNYDVIFGIVTNFEWSVDGNKFRCKTEITSKDRIYAGLVVDANTMDKESTEEKEDSGTKIFDSIIQFVDKSLDKFRNIIRQPPDSIPELTKFCNYVRKVHPDNANEYLYGVFFGRDPGDKKNKFQYKPNKDKDFDHPPPSKDLWLNLGLVIEAINFHCCPLKATKGEEMFHIDIDDVVVGAHPNMISSDGSICLIPNFESPHYFAGKYGPEKTESENYSPGDFDAKLKIADYVNPVPATLHEARKAKKLADFRLQDVCGTGGVAYRDDIDLVINSLRYENGIASGTCSFPFRVPHPAPGQNIPYPDHFSGYLKHIYVNLAYLKDILDNSSDITTYYKLVEKILEGINSACGGFWDLRLVSGQGDATITPDQPAPMKIVDYKFMSFSNRGKVWAFDYFGADSLLLGIDFRPTLSNAQAIRIIYAPTNNPENKTIVTNGTNELLEYMFRDRLKLGENVGNSPTPKADTSGFETTMHELQGIIPCHNAYQMTTDVNIRRLVMPASDIQKLLLDDSDEENNPKYTGIMPGIQASFTIQGIGGLRTFMMFLVRGLPQPYSEKNIVFRIIDVQDTIEAGNWTTKITAGVIPLRGHIKARLGIP